MIATAHLLILIACAAVAFYVCQPEDLPPPRPPRWGHWGCLVVLLLLAPRPVWAGHDPGTVPPAPENCFYPEWMSKAERYRCALGYFDRGCGLGDVEGCQGAERLRKMRPEELPDLPDPLLSLRAPAPAPWWVWWRWWPVPLGVLIAWIWVRADRARARRRP